MKKIATFFGIVLLTVGGAGITYYNHTRSPEYSLTQILRAYQDHDITKFEKYVDTKTVVRGLLDKIMDEVSNELNPESKAEKLGQDLGKGLFTLVRPRLEEVWVQQIQALVESGDIKSSKDDNQLYDIWEKNTPSSFEGVGRVDRDGKIASVFLDFSHPRFDRPLTLKVRMRDKGSYWQLFDVSGVLDYQRELNSMEQRRVDRLNEAVKSDFLKHVQLSRVKVHTTPAYSYTTRWYSHLYEIEFENISDKEIAQMTCSLLVRDEQGTLLEVVNVSKSTFRPGQKFIHRYEDVLSTKQIDPADITVTVNQVDLEFAHGTELRWHEPWEAI